MARRKRVKPISKYNQTKPLYGNIIFFPLFISKWRANNMFKNSNHLEIFLVFKSTSKAYSKH